MTEQARIETYKESLRLLYAEDIPGLRTKITALQTEVEESGVVITGGSFEGGQSNGQLVLEPLAKLNAAISLLKELDPDNVPDAEPNTFFADFSASHTET